MISSKKKQFYLGVPARKPLNPFGKMFGGLSWVAAVTLHPPNQATVALACLQDGSRVQNLQHRLSRTVLRGHEPLHHRHRPRGRSAAEHRLLLRLVPTVVITFITNTTDVILSVIYSAYSCTGVGEDEEAEEASEVDFLSNTV